MKLTQEKVSNYLIKKGFNKTDTNKMLKKHYTQVIRIYKDNNLTVKLLSNLITSFYCI